MTDVPRSPALRSGAHARSILAQHGCPNSTSVPKLHAIQARVRDSYPTILDLQEGRNRFRSDAGLRSPSSGVEEGAEEVQFD